MKAIDQPFTSIINGVKQFVIPVFQRDYSWTEDQCEQLWADVTRVGAAEKDEKHFLGSLVYIATEQHGPGFGHWLLIDGQQRFTTLTLLMTALRDHIADTDWSHDDGPTAKKIEGYFLRNQLEDGKRAYKLVLRRHDNETLQALIDKDDLSANHSERIQDNYDYFREQLKSSDPNQVFRGVGRLIVVDVTLDPVLDDPQMIFESLNSTGVDLSQSDLIRNFILMRLPEKQQTSLYEKYWSKIEALFRGSEKTFDAFARDFMAYRTQAVKQPKADQIYVTFRRLFPQFVEDAGDVESFLKEMLRFARYYAAFASGSGNWKDLHADLAHVHKLSELPAMLVMRLFDCHDRAGTLSTADFKSAIRLLESYIFRRAIMGAGTQSYWTIFAGLSYRIQEDSPLQSLAVGLARQQRESHRFPTDEEFRRELEQRDLYGLRVCRFMLERLENFEQKELTNTSDYSIEHILPQNENLKPEWRTMLGDDWKAVQETWVHRLGNLTLTAYNSTYSDRPFQEKQSIPGGFQQSSVRLNQDVRAQTSWSQPEIEARGIRLATQCLKVWPKLSVSAAEIEKAKQAELKDLAARRDVSKVPMSAVARQLFAQLQPQIMQINPDILEVAEKKSVSYHGPAFFLEVLPRKSRLLVSLPMPFEEVTDPGGVARDATEKKFYFHANYESGVIIRINEESDIPTAIPIIRQSLNASRS